MRKPNLRKMLFRIASDAERQVSKGILPKTYTEWVRAYMVLIRAAELEKEYEEYKKNN